MYASIETAFEPGPWRRGSGTLNRILWNDDVQESYHVFRGFVHDGDDEDGCSLEPDRHVQDGQVFHSRSIPYPQLHIDQEGE